MNRIPPALSYLTIYNTTLRPSQPFDKDDEDAEEQAQILFYTSRERAVSRDRMLRQIGLAKALINFSQSFGADDPCNAIHSQTRRMIMVSPEPNFWIHACVELGKFERVQDSKSKSKAKDKPSDKGKGKEVANPPLYDYEDGSVLDGALRARLMRGLEKFKLTHGSMTTILASLGQQALELQLERFWTVWAWTWDMEERPEFAEDCGPNLHPHFAPLIAILDDFCEHLSDQTSPVVLTRTHIIPSTKYTKRQYPASIATHLSSMIPPPIPPGTSDTVNSLAASVDTIRGRRSTDHTASGTQSRAKSPDGNGTFLGIPTNVDFNMDVTKWQWPGYLTFGKKNVGKPQTPSEQVVAPPVAEKDANAKDDLDTSECVSDSTPAEVLDVPHVETEVNADDLQDAIESSSMSMHSRTCLLTGEDKAAGEEVDGDVSSTKGEDVDSLPLLPEFSTTRVHLAPAGDPTVTKRIYVRYLVIAQYMLALLINGELPEDRREVEDMDLLYAAQNALSLISEIELVAREETRNDLSESLPSANKILQPQDRYLLSTRQYAFSSLNFSSNSGHLFGAKAILDREPDINEVFSRGHNPQHWHVARRGLGGVNSSLGIMGDGEEVYMEVRRKETSLADVDNVLTGVVKKSGLVEANGRR